MVLRSILDSQPDGDRKTQKTASVADVSQEISSKPKAVRHRLVLQQREQQRAI
jgi:hypothetical protein